MLKLVLYRLGVGNPSDRATPGLKLQNLRYAYGRNRSLPRTFLPIPPPHDTNPSFLVPAKSLYLLPLLTTIPSYLLSRLHIHALSSSFPEYPRGSLQRRWWLLLERLLAVGKFVELGGFLTFLWDGKYVRLFPPLLCRIATDGTSMQVPERDGEVTTYAPDTGRINGGSVTGDQL